jgi:hypothetical protein
VRRGRVVPPTRRRMIGLAGALVALAVVCLALSLVVQLGEAIRYQSGALAVESQRYSASELAVIFGAPVTAIVSLVLAYAISRRPLLIAVAIPLIALSVYHVYLALSRL